MVEIYKKRLVSVRDVQKMCRKWWRGREACGGVDSKGGGVTCDTACVRVRE